MQKLPVSKFAHGGKMPSARKAGPGRYHQQGLKAKKNQPKAPRGAADRIVDPGLIPAPGSLAMAASGRDSPSDLAGASFLSSELASIVRTLLGR